MDQKVPNKIADKISIDLNGEIRNAQSGPRPDLVAPVVEQMPAPPVKKKK